MVEQMVPSGGHQAVTVMMCSHVHLESPFRSNRYTYYCYPPTGLLQGIGKFCLKLFFFNEKHAQVIECAYISNSTP